MARTKLIGDNVDYMALGDMAIAAVMTRNLDIKKTRREILSNIDPDIVATIINPELAKLRSAIIEAYDPKTEKLDDDKAIDAFNAAHEAFLKNKTLVNKLPGSMQDKVLLLSMLLGMEVTSAFQERAPTVDAVAIRIGPGNSGERGGKKEGPGIGQHEDGGRTD